MMEEEEGRIDRISQLPVDVLVRILSFVPVEDVVGGAGLVSKAWQKLSELTFDRVLTFDYPPGSRSYSCLSSPSQEDIDIMMPSFVNAVNSSLLPERRLAGLRLYLNLDYFIESRRRSLIDSLIEAAIERKVALLYLRFLPFYPSNPYHLSTKVFSASRTITVLYLEGCTVEIWDDTNIHLPALRKLWLVRIEREEESVRKLISGCGPWVKDLKVSCCTLRKFHVLNPFVNLERLCVEDCNGSEKLAIVNAPRLQHLEYSAGRGLPIYILFESSVEFLREIQLGGTYMDDFYFPYMIGSPLPSVELLEITCNRWPGIRISHHQLKRLESLSISCCRWERIEILHRGLKRLDLRLDSSQQPAAAAAAAAAADATIVDTPNLQSFKYYGSRMPFIALISSMPSLNLTSLREVDIGFLTHNDRSHFFIFQLKQFFEKMKQHCQFVKLRLDVTFRQDFIISKKLRQILSPPVYDIKHLSLSVVYSRRRCPDMIDRLFWMCHPQTLSISSATNSKFLKVLYNKFRNKEGRPRCCSSCPIKCWRHYLEEVQIDGDESRFEIERIMNMMPDSLHAGMGCDVRFILKWRSQLL